MERGGRGRAWRACMLVPGAAWRMVELPRGLGPPSRLLPSYAPSCTMYLGALQRRFRGGSMPQRADNPAFNLLNRRAFFSKVGLTSLHGPRNARPGLQTCLAV